MHTGYNAKNKKELKEQLIDYVGNDIEDEDVELVKKANVESLASTWDLVIEKQKNKFEDINPLN